MNKKYYTNFGYKKVLSEEKENLVKQIFSNVANKYDLMNNLMSLGVHHLWKNRLIEEVSNFKGRIIDVAGGTGDISFRLYAKAKELCVISDIMLADINPDMLQIARDKAINSNILSGVDFLECSAENLPFEDNSFDYYIISFGIRNVTNINLALKEAHRVLKPLGKFICLEFSKINNSILENLYKTYSFNIVPKIGKIIASNEDAYKYLVETIDLFPSQEKFKFMIEEAEFNNVKYTNLSFGIASIHTAYKM